jgi:hypothetical protein
MPTMTPAPDFQWMQAQRTVRGVLARHGITGSNADDAVQEWTVSTMTADFTNPPYDPPAAAYMTAALVRRYGIGVILRDRVNQGRRAARRLGLEQPQPEGEPIGYRDTAAASANPATMAEAGEALAERCPRYAQQARARGMTPAALALVAAGWGPLDDEDAAKASPSVPQCGPGYTPPARGCRGLHGTRRPAAEPTYLDGLNLTAYRAALATYYAR